MQVVIKYLTRIRVRELFHLIQTIMTEDPIICGCNDVHRSTIENAIKEKGLKTTEQINKEFYFGKACGECLDDVREILTEVNGN
jgi:NAD(P)H-nitrite reductase large subunit